VWLPWSTGIWANIADDAACSSVNHGIVNDPARLATASVEQFGQEEVSVQLFVPTGGERLITGHVPISKENERSSKPIKQLADPGLQGQVFPVSIRPGMEVSRAKDHIEASQPELNQGDPLVRHCLQVATGVRHQAAGDMKVAAPRHCCASRPAIILNGMPEKDSPAKLSNPGCCHCRLHRAQPVLLQKDQLGVGLLEKLLSFVGN